VAENVGSAWPTHLHLTDLTTGDTRALTEGMVVDSHPSFGADDQEIFFTRNVKAVMRINAQSGQCDPVAKGAIDPVYLPATKELLFFVQDSNFQMEVWRMDIGTQEKRVLTASGGYKSSVRASSGSNRIFFLQEPKGNGLGTVYEISDNAVTPVIEVK
jgi:Tol biopolymer transport system component